MRPKLVGRCYLENASNDEKRQQTCYLSSDGRTRSERQTSVTQWIQQCSCKRTTAHVHYTKVHKYLTVVGAIALLAGLQALSFVGMFIRMGIVLELPYGDIQAYNTVFSKIQELMMPYEYLNTISLVLELLAPVLAIASVATLRSPRVALHKGFLIGTIVSTISYIVIMLLRVEINKRILEILPTMFLSGMVNKALEVQEKLDAAAGFWGSQIFNGLLFLLTLIAIGCFVGALTTSKVYKEWRPTPIVMSPAPS